MYCSAVACAQTNPCSAHAQEAKNNVEGAKPPGGLLEFSVVYTDRATNLMSGGFQQAMRDISSSLKRVYSADAVALIPGSGSYAMEAVARQFGTNKKVLIVRNGYFSFRWSDIIAMCRIPCEETVAKARAQDNTKFPQFAPYPIKELVELIHKEKPQVVFAPHVETAAGIVLPDEYVKQLGEAVHAVGGVFVLDCIASGSWWVNMKEQGIDVLISAPQKAWTAPASVGVVMMNERAKTLTQQSDVKEGGSFCCNLKKWTEVMDKYENGTFQYYTTLPTDALMVFRDTIAETISYGLERAKTDFLELGSQVRNLLNDRGYPAVAAVGFQAPGVLVSYARNNDMVAKFKAQGLQVAGGVPLMIDEPSGLMMFRLGLFGLDKIGNVPLTVSRLQKALDTIGSSL